MTDVSTRPRSIPPPRPWWW